MSALCAIAGGALRLVDSFTTELLSPATLAVLYFVTDILLLVAIAGLFSQGRRDLGRVATAGLVIAVLGTLAIRIAAFDLLGAFGYQIGAGVELLGLAICAVFWRAGPLLPRVLWLLSLVCAVVGALGVAPDVLTGAAGVTFGAGFVAAGAWMLRGQGAGTPPVPTVGKTGSHESPT